MDFLEDVKNVGAHETEEELCRVGERGRRCVVYI
jgi:hypothetical protein